MLLKHQGFAADVRKALGVAQRLLRHAERLGVVPQLYLDQGEVVQHGSSAVWISDRIRATERLLVVPARLCIPAEHQTNSAESLDALELRFVVVCQPRCGQGECGGGLGVTVAIQLI